MEQKEKKSDNGLNRYLEINQYLFEQTAPAPVEDPLAAAPAADPAVGEDPLAAAPPEEVPAGEVAPEEVPAAEEGGDPLEAQPTAEDDTTEEVDITDLVNMIKDVKKDMDEPKEDPVENQKMDDVFSKLSELEGKLGEMDQVLAKIDELGHQIEASRPPTPVEKLEMRSLDSGPFNEKPQEFFNEKQEEMKKSGKNEYVLTKGDVENYGKYDMMKSFNPTAQD